jgi:hypothetical protein
MKLYLNYCFVVYFGFFLLFPNKENVLTHTAKEFYVNISVKGKAIGTVSNLEGHFSFENVCIRK